MILLLCIPCNSFDLKIQHACCLDVFLRKELPRQISVLVICCLSALEIKGADEVDLDLLWVWLITVEWPSYISNRGCEFVLLEYYK